VTHWGEAGVFIALSPDPAVRNGDVEWPFRQDDDLKYLTGTNDRQTALVLLPSEKEWGECSSLDPPIRSKRSGRGRH
jgi:hypothetical protein